MVQVRLPAPNIKTDFGGVGLYIRGVSVHPGMSRIDTDSRPFGAMSPLLELRVNQAKALQAWYKRCRTRVHTIGFRVEDAGFRV